MTEKIKKLINGAKTKTMTKRIKETIDEEEAKTKTVPQQIKKQIG